MRNVVLREPDADGNYGNNGKFTVSEELTVDKDWIFLTALGGEAAAEIKDNEISIVIYNGSIQEGAGRLGYWNIVKPDSAEAFVTNIKKAQDRGSRGNVSTESCYCFSKRPGIRKRRTVCTEFSAEGKAGKSIKVTAVRKTFETILEGAEKSYSYEFEADAELSDKDIVCRIEHPGTFYLDDICIVEDTLIKYGSFQAGFVGFESYVDSSADAEYVVDRLTEDNAEDFAIRNTAM